MRRNVSFGHLVAALLAGASSSDALAQTPRVIPAEVQRVFIPEGFDDTDMLEVVVYGELEDSCHRVDQAVAEADPARGRIDVTVTALAYEGSCLPLRAPFLLPVRAGVLPAGAYTVHVNGSEEPRRRFTVAHSEHGGVDDFLYAPVSEASISLDEEGRQQLRLKGRFQELLGGSCTVIDGLRIYSAPEDVLVVLPTIEIRSGDGCQGVSRYFDFERPLPVPFLGPGLLHVRVQNGHSLNRYIDAGQTQ
jgi:hypothetical protein